MAELDINNLLAAIDDTRIALHEQAEQQYQKEVSAAWALWAKHEGR